MSPPTGPTPAFLFEVVKLNDEKHTAGHRRLRADLTETANAVNRDLDQIMAAQRADHERWLMADHERAQRTELSARQLVLLAAAIGTVPRLIEMVIALIKGTP